MLFENARESLRLARRKFASRDSGQDRAQRIGMVGRAFDGWQIEGNGPLPTRRHQPRVQLSLKAQ